ncbi:MAG: response regulator [Anaerolineae bacterium]|nr:response regulator [Anaerolineae bacterium]
MPPSKILIVEDESIVALDIRNRLIRMGYHVVGMAVTGEEAVDQAREKQPNLVLMDIRLKGEMDGIEAAAAIRACFEIPVIYLTAYADENTLQRAKITEPYGYLIKPFEERELTNVIEIALYKHRMEKRLRDQARQLQRIVNTVPQGMILLDGDCRIVTANPQAQEYLPALTDSLVNDRLNCLGNLTIAELLAEPASGLWHEMHLAGSPRRIFEVVANPIAEDTTSNNAVDTGWVLLIRDVTQERAMQQHAQEQERMAAVGQLAAGIAHDFKNIIAGIVLSAQVVMMRGSHLTPQDRENLNTICRQAMRANDLIRQILDFTRSSVMERHPLDVMPLLEELTQMLERTLPENIRLELQYQPGKYIVNGDTTRLTQALMNLILNARDAMPDGGGLRIELARGKAVPDGFPVNGNSAEWLQIKVADTGVGIPDDILPHIFEPFFTTKPPGKGTGLGLAQVYGIVQQHEGQIDVSSHVGSGTVFTIHMPVVPDEPVKKEAFALAGVPSLVQGQGQNLLVVEDNTELREAICDTLQLLNYRVMQASNGRDALTLISSGQYPVDLVISDLVMPEMGGAELCAELRQRGNAVPIIVMTGYSSEETMNKLRSLKVAECLQKPIDMTVLSAKIASLLQRLEPNPYLS